MKTTKSYLAILTCILFSNITFAQSLKDAPMTLKVGNWSVFRSVDTMTDKVSCTGIYKSNYGVQLTPNTLYVKILGGIQSVTLRFGEDSAQPMRLPQKLEKDVNTVIIDGREFTQVLESNRIRLQVLTLVRGVATEDLDTTGIQTAIDHIRIGCPVSSSATTPSPIAALVPVVLETEIRCSEQLVGRLKAAGVTEKQINASCLRN